MSKAAYFGAGSGLALVLTLGLGAPALALVWGRAQGPAEEGRGLPEEAG